MQLARMAPSRPPPLCKANALWWSRTYGQAGEAEAASGPAALDVDAFYRAIRDNRVDRVRRVVAEHPAAVFTKIFGDNERTALYVASFFGRHQIVKLLLRRGADKDLPCDGARPIDVAGFACTDPVDRMKVQSLLQVDACPQVLLRLDTRPGSSGETRRLQIHFSESVDEFTQEDVATRGCAVTAFSMLRGDLYVLSVRLSGGAASVQVPAGVARAAGGRWNAQSGPFHLASNSS